jgi:outer membrane protein assembly factor BamD (BamD/ComL family)
MKPFGSPRPGGLLFTGALLLLCLAMLSSSGCVKGPMIVCHPNYLHSMDKKAIDWEILHLEILLAENPDKAKQSASCFYLGLLHAHHDNPNPDYARALLMFDRYLSFNPKSGKSDEARYIRNILRKLADSDAELARMTGDGERERTRLLNEAERLRRLNSRLTKEKEELTAERENLRESIEQLKLLEHSLEEKRLRF